MTTLTIESLMQFVSGEFQIPITAITSKSRLQEIVQARHVFLYLACVYITKDYRTLAAQIKIDRSTAKWAIKAIQSRTEIDAKFSHRLKQISERLEGRSVKIA